MWSDGEVQAAGWASESELFRDYDWTMPYEFRTGVAEYLRTRRVASAELQGRAFLPQTLEELADFNVAHAEEELAVFGQVGPRAAVCWPILSGLGLVGTVSARR